jgi:hypothetical protein
LLTLTCTEMGKINDIIRDSNAEIIQSHNQTVTKQFGSNEGKLLGHNKAGYPVFRINGQNLIPLGFYVTEEKFADYYAIAKEISEKGMRTPTGTNERLLTSPDINSLLHYSLDFFINNYKISKNMKIKDIMALGKMMIKDLPQMMK